MKKLRPFIVHAWMTLNEVLKALGYTTAKRAGHLQGKKILLRGAVVFEGTADETWRWLRQTGQIA